MKPCLANSAKVIYSFGDSCKQLPPPQTPTYKDFFITIITKNNTPYLALNLESVTHPLILLSLDSNLKGLLTCKNFNANI